MAQTSYAQYGQDLMINFMLKRKQASLREKGAIGYYIDVGCCDPIAGSNTYLFYKAGWRGLCIDANPDIAENFRKERPGDVVLSCGVGSEPETLKFYRFLNPQHNTFNEGRAKRYPDKVESIIEVPVRTLTSLIEENLPLGKRIDLLSIDAEGFETKILSAMDFTKLRPTLIIIEMFSSLRQAFDQPSVQLLENAGYKFMASTGHDAIFLDQ